MALYLRLAPLPDCLPYVGGMRSDAQLRHSLPAADPADALRLIGKKPLAQRLGISCWTLMRWVRLGRFPKPIRLSDQVLAWRMQAVEQWLLEREEECP